MPFGSTFGALVLSSVKDLMLQRAWPQCLQADFLELFLGVFFEVLFWRCVLFGAAGFHVADFETQKGAKTDGKRWDSLSTRWTFYSRVFLQNSPE